MEPDRRTRLDRKHSLIACKVCHNATNLPLTGAQVHAALAVTHHIPQLLISISGTLMNMDSPRVNARALNTAQKGATPATTAIPPTWPARMQMAAAPVLAAADRHQVGM